MTAEKGAAQQISFQSVAAPRLRQCILPAPRAQAYHPGTGQVSAAKGTSCLHLPALAQRARGPQAQVSGCEGRCNEKAGFKDTTDPWAGTFVTAFPVLESGPGRFGDRRMPQPHNGRHPCSPLR